LQEFELLNRHSNKHVDIQQCRHMESVFCIQVLLLAPESSFRLSE
jgi:hypothetical protein